MAMMKNINEPEGMAITYKGLKLLLLGLVIMIAGYILMAGGNSNDRRASVRISSIFSVL